ncbi:uncharacterized protein EAF01_009930 [Botrytis porri]|uniref:uncharacterized protein n=1 Tax=Botrytis porri TaxID=87229 RepID=UPI0019011CD3|nr:uncharacterized protein EAF01_009930 [Botrytis porri]KAF7894479.1 hypothetical protein EAF01_009930 [Botrytis porri]
MKEEREFSRQTAPWTVVIEIHMADSSYFEDAGTGNWGGIGHCIGKKKQEKAEKHSSPMPHLFSRFAFRE